MALVVAVKSDMALPIVLSTCQQNLINGGPIRLRPGAGKPYAVIAERLVQATSVVSAKDLWGHPALLYCPALTHNGFLQQVSLLFSYLQWAPERDRGKQTWKGISFFSSLFFNCVDVFLKRETTPGAFSSTVFLFSLCPWRFPLTGCMRGLTQWFTSCQITGKNTCDFECPSQITIVYIRLCSENCLSERISVFHKEKKTVKLYIFTVLHRKTIQSQMLAAVFLRLAADVSADGTLVITPWQQCRFMGHG